MVNETEWCCKCEKCAFVFIILSAFLPPQEVEAVFHGHNLFKNKDMNHTFISLVGGCGDGEKPFECVGTFAETQAAVEMALGVQISTNTIATAATSTATPGKNGSQSRLVSSGSDSSVPPGLQAVCDYMELSTKEPPESSVLPLEEKFAAMMDKYMTASKLRS